MIIARMDGGLGNQFFQYAYGRYLASQHATELLLDTSSYAGLPQHGYQLDRFCIDAQVASPEQLHGIPRRYQAPRASALRHALRNLVFGAKLRRHKEKPFGFHPRHLQAGNHRYLVGYWQSERFFPGLRETLLQQFTLREPLSEPSARIAEKIQTSQSIALHVRRGDYLSNPQAAALYCQLDQAYYMRALNAWAESQSRPQVFIFSNDIGWCRQHFQLPYPTTFVDHNHAATAHEDLILMSQAKACVIANSTFSWWAAWLNVRQDKVVFAPPQWFQSGTLDDSNIVPPAWQNTHSNLFELAAA